MCAALLGPLCVCCAACCHDRPLSVTRDIGCAIACGSSLCVVVRLLPACRASASCGVTLGPRGGGPRGHSRRLRFRFVCSSFPIQIHSDSVRPCGVRACAQPVGLPHSFALRDIGYFVCRGYRLTYRLARCACDVCPPPVWVRGRPGTAGRPRIHRELLTARCVMLFYAPRRGF